MFGIGGFEFLLILLFAFLVFGPDKLPEIARTAGELIARFRQAKEEMDSVVRSELSGKDESSSASKPASHRRAVSAKPAPGSASRSSKSAAAPGDGVAAEAGSTVRRDGKTASSRVVKVVDDAAEAARASAHEQRVAVSQATETFAERKARYERERQEENRRAMRDQAAKAKEPDVTLPSAAELYGNVPYGATTRPSVSKSSDSAKEVE